MAKLDMGAMYSILMPFLLFQEIVTVSSEECDANIFYDFMYCLSPNSRCGQCMPCYNNASLYIPTDNGHPSMPCTDAICANCTANCATNFNAQQYNTKSIQNVDSSDTECPLLKRLVAEIHSDISPNIDAETPHNSKCDSNQAVSIQYAMITSTTHYHDYTQDDTADCTLDFTHEAQKTCNDGRPNTFCDFDLHPYIPPRCNTENGFTAVIGYFCVSTKATVYASNALLTQRETANSIPYSNALIWTLIIVPWSILCITTLVALIFFLTRLQGCSMQCKKVSDSRTRKLKPRQSAERINSDIVGDGSNKGKKMMTSTGSGAVHHPRSTVQSSSPHMSHTSSNRKRHDVEAQNIANAHNYRSQVPHRPQRGGTGTNRNVYQNVMHRGGASSATRSIKAKHAISSQDTMIVQFPPREAPVSATTDSNGIRGPNNMSAAPMTAYHGYNDGGYDPAIPITNGHGRNSSVIMSGVPPTQQNGLNVNGWPGLNTTQRGVHPMNALNQSTMNDTVLSTYDTGIDELAHSLIYRSNVGNAANHNTASFEQKQEYYDTYWNQYYGVPPQTQQSAAAHQAQAQFHSAGAAAAGGGGGGGGGGDYFDFANPNGDATMNVSYDDDSKIQMVLQNEIQLEAEIGRGSSSKVFKARWRNTEVAAKRFAPTFGVDLKKAKQYVDDFVSKVKKEPHPNVIIILAFAHKPFTMVTEYLNKGSVKNYVRRTRPGSTSISILDRIEIAFQAAKGLQHLHQLGIIHSEINCQNLLMEIETNNNNNNNNNGANNDNKERIRVVVTDYALQNILSGDELETYRSSLGPLKWMAPECIENSSAATTKESDIYAFGITMWEIITGQEPYQDVDPVDTAIHVLVKQRRPQSYAFIPEKIQNLMKICWHKHASKRPNAEKVVEVLSQFIQTERKQNANRHDLL